MKSVLFAALVLVLGCGSTLVDFPSLSGEDRLSFTEEEEGAFPQREKYEEGSYPDAVVRTWKKVRPNKEVRKAVDNFVCFHPAIIHLEQSGGNTSVTGERPYISSVVETTKWSITTIGTRIIHSLLLMKLCFHNTQKCDTLEIETVVALRERPIELEESAWDSIRMWEDSIFRGSISSSKRTAVMLEITHLRLISLVVRAIDIRDGRVTAGQCGVISVVTDFSMELDGWDVIEPFRSNIVGRLARNDYLSYQSLQSLEDDLIEYQKALNGCYAGSSTKEVEVLQRGKETMRWILDGGESPARQ